MTFVFFFIRSDYGHTLTCLYSCIHAMTISVIAPNQVTFQLSRVFTTLLSAFYDVVWWYLWPVTSGAPSAIVADDNGGNKNHRTFSLDDVFNTTLKPKSYNMMWISGEGVGGGRGVKKGVIAGWRRGVALIRDRCPACKCVTADALLCSSCNVHPGPGYWFTNVIRK